MSKYIILAKNYSETIEKVVDKKPSKKDINDMYKKYDWFQITWVDNKGKIKNRHTYEVMRG